MMMLRSYFDPTKGKIYFRNLLLLAVSSILTLLVAEGLLANFYPQKTLKAAEVFSPFCFRQSDYLPMQLQPNASCRQIQEEFNITVNTNSLGYRNPEFALQKLEDQKRVLILGDSFAFGYGVEDDQTFARILEKNFKESSPSMEFINASYNCGDSPDSYYAYLNREGLALSPDVVIMAFFVGNDFTDLFETKWLETDSDGLPVSIGTVDRFIDEQGRLLHPSMPLNYTIPILKNSHLFQLAYYRLKPKKEALNYRFKKALNIKTELKFAHPQPHPFCIHDSECINKDAGLAQNVQAVLQLIKASHQLSTQAGARFILLIIPSDIQIYPDAWKKWGTSVTFANQSPDQPQAILTSFLEKNEIEFIDLLPEFRNIIDRLYYPKDAHFNLLGQQKTAEIIREYLSLNE